MSSDKAKVHKTELPGILGTFAGQTVLWKMATKSITALKAASTKRRQNTDIIADS